VADLRISELPVLLPADAEAGDDLAVADYSSSETRRLTLKGGVQQVVSTLLDNGVIPGAKLVADSVTTLQLAPNAVTASELADGSVDTAALMDLSVTNSKLAAGIDGSKLTADSVTAAQIGPNAITASELADGAVDTAAIQDSGVTNVKLAAGIDGAKLIADSVTATQIAPNAITASELADGAVDTAAIQDAAVTNIKLAPGIDGAKLTDGSVSNAELAAGIDGAKLTNDTVTAAKVPASSLDRGLDKSSGAIGHTNVITTGTRNGLTFDGHGHITATARLESADLPPATSTAIGAVSVPAASGLIVSGIGALDHANTVPPSIQNGISYDDHGHITGSAPLVPSDLPIATSSTVGAVMVPGPGLAMGAAGAIVHTDSGVAAGAYAKVEVDLRGHVTAGLTLIPSDIPSLDASKINTGTFDAARLADRSIPQDKLADYAISFIQEAQPTSVNLYHNGMLWYQESTAQLHMWNGNSWMPVGSLGRLGTENMRFSGTWNAATGSIIDLTTFGTSGGFVAGSLPVATDASTGAYFVCVTPGTYAGTVYDAGDWVLSLGALKGWVRIDTLNGAGTSTVALKDLIDTTITTPGNGDTLIFDITLNKWVNRPTAAQKATFTQALDGTRTTFTLSRDGSHANSLLISIGGVIQEPGVDFTFAGPRTVNFAAPPPAGVDYWVLIEGVVGTGGGGGGGGGTVLPDGTAAEEVLTWDATLSSWQPKAVISGGVY
jgi:hypothetical protein